jgi:hypothetical protein
MTFSVSLFVPIVLALFMDYFFSDRATHIPAHSSRTELIRGTASGFAVEDVTETTAVETIEMIAPAEMGAQSSGSIYDSRPFSLPFVSEITSQPISPEVAGDEVDELIVTTLDSNSEQIPFPGQPVTAFRQHSPERDAKSSPQGSTFTGQPNP